MPSLSGLSFCLCHFRVFFPISLIFPFHLHPDRDTYMTRMPPAKNMDDWWTILRSGLWRLYYKLSREGKTRFYSEFLPLLHDTKHEILQERDDKSWYLVYIGTKPSARGKGYARTLIEHGTAIVSSIIIGDPLGRKHMGRLKLSDSLD